MWPVLAGGEPGGLRSLPGDPEELQEPGLLHPEGLHCQRHHQQGTWLKRTVRGWSGALWVTVSSPACPGVTQEGRAHRPSLPLHSVARHGRPRVHPACAVLHQSVVQGPDAGDGTRPGPLQVKTGLYKTLFILKMGHLWDMCSSSLLWWSVRATLRKKYPKILIILQE